MAAQVLSDVVIEKSLGLTKLRDFVLVLVGSWVIALLAQVAIYLPFTPVPITGQSFAVLFIAAVLGKSRGLLSVAAYLLQGIVGLPFFAGGSSGFHVLKGATGGYLIGFLLAAYVVGWFAERAKDREFMTALPAFLLGKVIIFAYGVGWLGSMIGFRDAIQQGLLPFIPGAVVKLFLLSLILPVAWRWAKK